MPTLSFFQVNAFTTSPFGGNPAGVCVVHDRYPDNVLQQIAAEAGFSETAFIRPMADHYELRWFTPSVEVDICGHATLASAAVVLDELESSCKSVVFYTRSGVLTVERDDRGGYVMDFPEMAIQWVDGNQQWRLALGASPTRVGSGAYGVALFESAEAVRALSPDRASILALDYPVVVVTAPGNEPDIDFVLRVFGPKIGIDEDPVTGSAMCALVPYWANRLGKSSLTAWQLSRRGGILQGAKLGNGRVSIGGTVWVYSRGKIIV